MGPVLAIALVFLVVIAVACFMGAYVGALRLGGRVQHHSKEIEALVRMRTEQIAKAAAASAKGDLQSRDDHQRTADWLLDQMRELEEGK